MEGKEIKGKCIVCGGNIVEDVRRKHNPVTGSPMIGPASEHQFYDVHEGYYCESCGLKYQYPPKEA